MAPKKETLERTAKACKAMEAFGVSAKTVKSALKRLHDAYNKNWTFIEDDNYRVLIEAIFEPEAPKVLNQDTSNDMQLAIFEPEVPKVLNQDSSNDMHLALDTINRDFNLCDEPEEEAEPLKKRARVRSQSGSSPEAGTSVPCSEMKKTVEIDGGIIDILEDDQCEGKKPFSQFEIPLAVIHPAPTERLCGSDSSAKSLEERNKLMALEYNKLDNKGNENEDPSPCSSEIDIASSSNGEVKLSFSICKPSLHCRIQSLDAVMKQVEERYRGSIQGLGTEFSLSELLRNLCESFVQQSYCSDCDTQTLDSFKEPEKQVVLHNPIDGPAQIPRFVVSSAFKNLHHVNVPWLREQSLTIFSKEQSLVDICSNHYSVVDITRGFEEQEISLINEVNDERLPAFTYIPKNVNYKSANVKFILARISDENCCSHCVGDCLSLQVPCACAAETGGEFAYTTEGSLKKNFLKSCISIGLNPTKANYVYCDDCPLERKTKSGSCRGHLVRKFIKECWYKCGCDLSCRNRVVQRGIKAKLQVFMTREGKGWGLRTLEDLSKGTFVCEYVGEIVTNSELFERNEQNKDKRHTYPVLLDADWSSEGFLKDEEALCLDATYFGNVARFINHRCVDANMVEIPVEVETPDHHYYHLAFFTTREVKAMEELTWDYGIDFDDDSHPVKAFQCKCGSKSCRNIKHKRRTRRGQC